MMARFYGYINKVFQFRELTSRLTDSRLQPVIPTAAVFGTAFAMFATCRGSLNGIDKERHFPRRLRNLVGQHVPSGDTVGRVYAQLDSGGLTMLQQGHFETRRLIAGVRPPILDESGVVEAVAHLVHEQSRDKGPKIENRSRVDFGRLDPTLENAIYRIAQEALTNACKYSQSERVQVSLLQRADRVRIEIRDWGVGFDPKVVPKSRFGLEGIRQRARLLGGKCSIRSTAGKGTRIMVELPVVLRDEGE